MPARPARPFLKRTRPPGGQRRPRHAFSLRAPRHATPRAPTGVLQMKGRAAQRGPIPGSLKSPPHKAPRMTALRHGGTASPSRRRVRQPARPACHARPAWRRRIQGELEAPAASRAVAVSPEFRHISHSLGDTATGPVGLSSARRLVAPLRPRRPHLRLAIGWVRPRAAPALLISLPKVILDSCSKNVKVFLNFLKKIFAVGEYLYYTDF